MRWYSVEDDGETGTHTPPGFGGGKYPYLTGSGGRVFEAGHAVLHRERLLGDGSVGAEGVLSGQASLPAAARRHYLQISRDDRVSRLLYEGDRRRADSAHQLGGDRKRGEPV